MKSTEASRPATVLVVDDEPLFLKSTADLLRNAGFHCLCAPEGYTAGQILERNPVDLIISDLNMPGNMQFELLRRGRTEYPEIPLIVVTGAPSLPSAIESVRLHIADYLLKPVRFDDLLASVHRALSHARQQAVSTPRSTAPSQHRQLIGRSPAIEQVRSLIERVAASDVNVLITGESGTGKEVVARAIHQSSRRAARPLVAIDCAALAEGLIESTLFGHSKGAFTGAETAHEGLLKQADGGTALLDEIGDLPLGMQAKLLRAIQEGSFRPVGQDVEVSVDIRMIAATNRNLLEEMNRGAFRRDLFYRLAVVHVTLPPLRERTADIRLLAEHFLQELAAVNPEVTTISEASLELLEAYDWPGNVRQLRNVIERALSLTRSTRIEPADLPAELGGSSDASSGTLPRPGRHSRLAVALDAERQFLLTLLDQCEGNVSRAARQAGLSRQGLHKLLKKHQLSARDFR